MQSFPHIPRTGRMGRTRVLPVRPVLHDARNLPAPIISVIIGLPLPVFATACILLPVAPAAPAALPALPALPLQPASLPAACSACSACSAALPLCRSACSSPPACKKSETLKSLAFLLSGLGLRQPPPRLSAHQSRKPSRTSCSRILAQSATGCFSPSMNRSGHPRLQSSM